MQFLMDMFCCPIPLWAGLVMSALFFWGAWHTYDQRVKGEAHE
jgi:hypothetical protein